MDILALDVGRRMGVARGPAGKPDSFVVVLKAKEEPQDIAGANLIGWLDKNLDGVDLVFKEAAPHLGGFAAMGNAAHTVAMTLGLHFVIESMCRRHKVPIEGRAASTIRKHFIGKGQLGSRSATKKAVIDRCHLLGILPTNSRDDDRADALANHDFAAAHFARQSPQALHLFGEEKPCGQTSASSC